MWPCCPVTAEINQLPPLEGHTKPVPHVPQPTELLAAGHSDSSLGKSRGILLFLPNLVCEWKAFPQFCKCSRTLGPELRYFIKQPVLNYTFLPGAGAAEGGWKAINSESGIKERRSWPGSCFFSRPLRCLVLRSTVLTIYIRLHLTTNPLLTSKVKRVPRGISPGRECFSPCGWQTMDASYCIPTGCKVSLKHRQCSQDITFNYKYCVAHWNQYLHLKFPGICKEKVSGITQH